jgi:hypothetical protein
MQDTFEFITKSKIQLTYPEGKTKDNVVKIETFEFNLENTVNIIFDDNSSTIGYYHGPSTPDFSSKFSIWEK